MTAADLRRYNPVWRLPTYVNYRGFDVFGMGPPSSGGSTIGEALNILERYPLQDLDSEQVMHLRLEASRLAFADRGAYVADPAFYRVPLKGLLSERFAASRRALIGEQRGHEPGRSPATPSPTAGPVARASRRRPRRGRGRRRTSRPPTARATSSPTRSRSSRPAAPASSCPATASC